MSATLVDARGRSCPEPAMMTRKALMNAGKGSVIVVVDSVTARDNVARTASLAGWKSTVEQQSDGSYRVTLTQ